MNKPRTRTLREALGSSSGSFNVVEVLLGIVITGMLAAAVMGSISAMGPGAAVESTNLLNSLVVLAGLLLTAGAVTGVVILVRRSSSFRAARAAAAAREDKATYARSL